ncbi:DeoR/GlpR family DNA-binding transcription regulator [Agromyces sp. Marseille-P2726]|uniref:DeoR/GlpR family DNA-binding transcription regulator n=1 Tax=Agromyces sp. Marseille-P2726 TaxID=2709132 RepID=UPI00157050C4|nr:DeoR/GlpR family DNA-binding transcription regulator [Agromyces sp. Marseille-P2726]
MTDEKVFADERRYEILQRVRAAGRVEVSSLATEYGVSTETIRQDLNSLQESGVIRRTHGGAVPVDRTLIEPRVTERTTFSAEKRAIAGAAVAHVPPGGSIFIESGSTSLLLAESLPDDVPLTVFTNSLPVAVLLAQRPNATVITLGGRVRPVTLGEVDSFALRSLRDIHVDTAFLGTNGLSVEHGLTTPDQSEADVKREMLRISGHTVLLADRSKLGTVSLWRYGSVTDVDVVITSARADAAEIELLRATGTAVELA